MSFPVRKIRTTRDRDSRGTLKPTVSDFSEVVIGRYTPYQEANKNQIWSSIVSTLRESQEAINNRQGESPKKSQFLRENPIEQETEPTVDDDHLCVSTVAQAQCDSMQLPRPHSTVTYSALEQHAQNHIPASFTSPRSNGIGHAEAHRRHVAKSARLRSRLGGNKHLKRIDSRSRELSLGSQEVSVASVWPESRLTSPRTRPQSSSEFKIHSMTPRSRPATSGRYFDTSNGLVTKSTVRLTSRSRPQSSRLQSGLYDMSDTRPLSGRPSSSRSQYANRPSAWVGAGLRIQQMTLNMREGELMGGISARPFV